MIGLADVEAAADEGQADLLPHPEDPGGAVQRSAPGLHHHQHGVDRLAGRPAEMLDSRFHVDDHHIIAIEHDLYQQALAQVSSAPITTEILSAPVFYFAETYHQQYLAKNPGGYCGLGGCGVPYPAH